MVDRRPTPLLIGPQFSAILAFFHISYNVLCFGPIMGDLDKKAIIEVARARVARRRPGNGRRGIHRSANRSRVFFGLELF